MLWVIILTVIHVREISSLQEEGKSPSNRILYNDLSITYDHCRAPLKLNRESWTCECPESLIKRGDDCVCENCLFETRDESYAEKNTRDLPEYVAGFIKDLNAENVSDPGGIAARMFGNAESKERSQSGEERRRRKRKRMERKRRKIREYAKKIMVAVGSICGFPTGGRRSMTIVTKSDSPFKRFLNGFRIGKYWKPEFIRLKKVDWSKARILNVEKVPSYPHVVRPEVLNQLSEEDGMTYSATSIGDVMRGRVYSGDDKAYGLMSNLYGTGSLSMGVGQGGALGSAYTGEGISISGLESRGGKAYGKGLIGKKGYRGSSTTSLLIGEGDAIATNSLSKKSSASATAVATKKVATAGSTAFGAASAAASATPGKGAADGSASFGDGIAASANVTGKSRNVAETASVGNEGDDLRDLVHRQRESQIDDNIHREGIFGGRHSLSSDFNILGLSDENPESDWFG